jgi:hypothetical protein
MIFAAARAPADAPLQDVRLRNIVVGEAKTPLVLENVERLRLEGVVLGGQRLQGELRSQALGGSR